MTPAEILVLIQIVSTLATLAKTGVSLAPSIRSLLGVIQPHLPVIETTHPAEHRAVKQLLVDYPLEPYSDPASLREAGIFPDN